MEAPCHPNSHSSIHSFSHFSLKPYGACPWGQDAGESEQNQKQFMVGRVRQTYTTQYMTGRMDTCTNKRSGSRCGSPEEVAISSDLERHFQKCHLQGFRKEKEKCCPGTCLSGLFGVCRLFGDQPLCFTILTWPSARFWLFSFFPFKAASPGRPEDLSK